MMVYFIAPEHNRSLAGSLAEYAKGRHIWDENWHDVKEIAWEAAAGEDRVESEKSSWRGPQE